MASKHRKFEASIELHRVLGHKQTVALHDKKQREKKAAAKARQDELANMEKMNKQFVTQIEIEQLRSRLAHSAGEAEAHRLQEEGRSTEAAVGQEKMRQLQAELESEQQRSTELGAELARVRKAELLKVPQHIPLLRGAPLFPPGSSLGARGTPLLARATSLGTRGVPLFTRGISLGKISGEGEVEEEVDQTPGSPKVERLSGTPPPALSSAGSTSLSRATEISFLAPSPHSPSSSHSLHSPRTGASSPVPDMPEQAVVAVVAVKDAPSVPSVPSRPEGAPADAPGVFIETEAETEEQAERTGTQQIEQTEERRQEQERAQAQALEAFSAQHIPHTHMGHSHMVLASTEQTGLGLPINRTRTWEGQGHGGGQWGKQGQWGQEVPDGLFIPSLFGQPGTYVGAVREQASTLLHSPYSPYSPRLSGSPRLSPRSPRASPRSKHKSPGGSGGAGGERGRPGRPGGQSQERESQERERQPNAHNAMFVLSAAPNLSFDAISRGALGTSLPYAGVGGSVDSYGTGGSGGSGGTGGTWYGAHTGVGAHTPTLSLQEQIYRYAELSALFQLPEDEEEGGLEEEAALLEAHSRNLEREVEREVVAKLSLDIARHRARLVHSRVPVPSKYTPTKPPSKPSQTRLYNIR
ncbi:hypothetical protein B484DRAFT_481316 [Ochromonadaceae sp. CCMP2298]|nr:hypothetical protein B484DRAFT_481316 [Ochromonadaceae sp. CCMP2298]